MAPITVLLSRCGPSAIPRLVVAVIVNALNRQVGWLVAHVGIEIHERLAPALAHRYTACSVILKRMVVGILTATNHAGPRSVFARGAHAVSAPRSAGLGRRFAAEAAAAFHAPKIVRRRRSGIAARTSTGPEAISFLIEPSGCNNSQATECGAYKVSVNHV